MEAAGLVRRDPDPRDGRAAFAAITPQGRSLVKKARHSHHEFLRRTFAEALDDEDLAHLARIMDRVSASIPVQYPTPAPARHRRSTTDQPVP